MPELESNVYLAKRLYIEVRDTVIDPDAKTHAMFAVNKAYALHHVEHVEINSFSVGQDGGVWVMFNHKNGVITVNVRPTVPVNNWVENSEITWKYPGYEGNMSINPTVPLDRVFDQIRLVIDTYSNFNNR